MECWDPANLSHNSFQLLTTGKLFNFPVYHPPCQAVVETRYHRRNIARVSRHMAAWKQMLILSSSPTAPSPTQHLSFTGGLGRSSSRQTGQPHCLTPGAPFTCGDEVGGLRKETLLIRIGLGELTPQFRPIVTKKSPHLAFPRVPHHRGGQSPEPGSQGQEGPSEASR